MKRLLTRVLIGLVVVVFVAAAISNALDGGPEATATPVPTVEQRAVVVTVAPTRTGDELWAAIRADFEAYLAAGPCAKGAAWCSKIVGIGGNMPVLTVRAGLAKGDQAAIDELLGAMAGFLKVQKYGLERGVVWSEDGDLLGETR